MNSMVNAVLQALARTPEEEADFWLLRHREEYAGWWDLEENLAVLERHGTADEEIVRQVRAKQSQIQNEQAGRADIRCLLCDSEGE